LIAGEGEEAGIPPYKLAVNSILLVEANFFEEEKFPSRKSSINL
jgi:hypothetical protein